MAAVRASPRLRSLPLLFSQPDAAATVRRCFFCASASASPSPAPSRAMASPSSSSAAPSPYTTLAGRVSCEREIKRSKFIAIAAPVPNERAAMAFLDEVKDPKATHNCWAYKLGEQFRYNDDGEPSSTAGKPIYSAIISSGIDMVMVVVIRYFGGIKLGTGGLVRAYGGVASECLKDAPTCLVKPKARVGMEVPFDLLGTVYHQTPPQGALIRRRRLPREFAWFAAFPPSPCRPHSVPLLPYLPLQSTAPISFPISTARP
ncbi:IMPACT family member in pol 5'region-like isoform X1 [Panicum virgatum]|uniref:IMPACT family member in pol 5'region-like isoform X1 n=1 Tax=Panicum virgatum TaxID=38727 RepID=UPI0019D6729F|nr:IMPACT family member in pol 5'region-like isoform X1 [Panicum virgatum]